MSTPAIRATQYSPLLMLAIVEDDRLALALLVSWVVANDHDATTATNHLALVADPLDARTNLHVAPVGLLVAVDHSAPAEVVGAQFDQYLVAGKDSDVMHPHLSRDVSEYLVTVVELDAKHRVGQRLGDGALDLNALFLGRARTLLFVLLSHARY